MCALIEADHMYKGVWEGWHALEKEEVWELVLVPAVSDHLPDIDVQDSLGHVLIVQRHCEVVVCEGEPCQEIMINSRY